MNLLLIGFTIGIIAATMLAAMTPLILQVMRRGKARILFINRDLQTYKLGYYPRNDSEVTIGEKTYILEARGRINGEHPLFVIDSASGWNYVPPTTGDVALAFPNVQRLSVTDPAVYHHRAAHNAAQHALTAERGDDNMWVKLAPWMLGALCIIVAMLGFVVYKISNSGAAAPVGA